MKWWYMLAGIVGLYAMVVVLLNMFLDKVLFLPEKLPADYVFEFEHDFEELWLEEGGLRINALWFKADEPIRGLVLYFHGNADNLQRWGKYVVDITRLGYEVLAIDYPGYGKSSGSPSEESIYQSAEMAWNWAMDHYSADSVIIYGRSLGSGAASYLSAQHQARLLILETPFYSIPDVLRKRFPVGIWWNDTYQFPNYQYISDSPNDVFIFQGTADRVVPYTSAIQLRPLLSDTNDFIVLQGGTHHNLSQFARYHERLAIILR